jgi:hypothetical protein
MNNVPVDKKHIVLFSIPYAEGPDVAFLFFYFFQQTSFSLWSEI